MSGDARNYSYAVKVAASNVYNLGAMSTLSVTETGPLFVFTSFTFNTAGYEGNTAPTLDTFKTEYAGQDFINKGYFSLYKNYNGYQRLTVPSSGMYTITAIGASGGRCTSRAGVGGFGGSMSARFRLSYGQLLIMLVGQKGGNGTADECGGGGGTFVVTVDSRGTLTPLLVAGGGGGACKYNDGTCVTGLTPPGGNSGRGTTGNADGFGYSSFQGNGLWGKVGFNGRFQGGFGGGGIENASFGGGGGGYQGGNGGPGVQLAGRGGWSYVASHLTTCVTGSLVRDDNYNSDINYNNGNGWVSLSRA